MSDIYISFGGDNYSGNIGFTHKGRLLSIWRKGTHHETDEQKIYIPDDLLREVIGGLRLEAYGRRKKMIRVHFTFTGTYEFDEELIQKDVESHIDAIEETFIDRLGYLGHGRNGLDDVESEHTQEEI